MSSQKNTDYKTLLEERGEISFVPSGNSMWPILKDRSQTVVVKKKTARLKEFDVAFFEKDGVFVLHRVLSVTDNGYITCGDSQLKSESITEDAVLGVLTGFYKGDRFIDVNDKTYAKKVRKWYKRGNLRKFRIKCFYFLLRVKNKFKKIKKG